MATKRLPRLDEVFRFLREAKCPYCGDPNAYVGLNKVECPNCGGDPAKAKQLKATGATQSSQSSGGMQHGGITAQGIDALFRAKPNQRLFDHFSKNPQEYRKNISDVLDKFLGKGWHQEIEKGYGPGATDEIFKKLWDGNYTDHEGVDEVGFYYDNCYRGDVKHYPLSHIGKKYAYDPATGDYDERQQRPMSPADVS